MKSVIIDRLIQIEESAHNITKDIEEKEESLPALIQKEGMEIEARFKAEYEKKSAEIKALKQKECESKIAEVEKDSAARYKKLDEYFEKNHQTWESDIFNSIIGR